MFRMKGFLFESFWDARAPRCLTRVPGVLGEEGREEKEEKRKGTFSSCCYAFFLFFASFGPFGERGRGGAVKGKAGRGEVIGKKLILLEGFFFGKKNGEGFKKVLRIY